MSNYLADGLQNGFSIGAQAMQNKLERDLRNELRLKRDAQAVKDNTAADAIRAEQRLREDAAAEQSRNDPRNVLAREKAQRELVTLNNPQPPSEDDQLAAFVMRLELQKKRDALLAPQAPVTAPVPKAKVHRNLGADGKGGYAEFEVPQTDLEKTLGAQAANAYKSPYADQIASLQSGIAKQQAYIDGGDKRTGFLGIGTSRVDNVATSQRQLIKLQALELQDMVKAGAISQAEADARANELMGVK